MSAPAWRKDAACRGEDVNIFFPIDYGQAVKAKKICAACPVRVQCLDWALSHPQAEDAGIFGGTSFRERRKIRRALARFDVAV